MDQDSFRNLLSVSTSGPTRGSSSTAARGNLFPSASSKSKKIEASQPVFKPRKIKKAGTEGKYRDRAAERREGGGNDYAHVEAVLEDFERRNANNEDKKAVEEQRKYLGGDREHSILVKGLDMALLEQNKARTLLDSPEEDESLEQAYLEVSVPKKRTRADIINELKQQRGQADEEVDKSKNDAKTIEEAKRQGKFKPIGFKPIGASEEKGKKRKKKVKSVDGTTKDGGERRKKHKVEAVEVATQREGTAGLTSSAEQPLPAPTTEADPKLEPDLDIFAGVGDYDELDLGDDDDDYEEDGTESKVGTERKGALQRPAPSGSKGWFMTEDESEDEEPPNSEKPVISSHDSKIKTRSPGRRGQGDHDVDMEGDEAREEEPSMRLQPLSSSTVPSIRDILAMDDAAAAEEKRRKRKEKKKSGAGGGGGEKSMEEKVNRDYQRLQSYTRKKEASGSR